MRGKALIYYSTAALGTGTIKSAWASSSLSSRRMISYQSSTAFLSTYSTSTSAFTCPLSPSFPLSPVHPSPNSHSKYGFINPNIPSPLPKSLPFINGPKRLFFSKSNSNDNNDSMLKKVAKSILPKSLFQSKEEKQRAMELKRQRESIEGGVSTLLKDFPLPIRMMRKLITPMLSSLASQVQEQTRETADLIDDCRIRIMNNADVQTLLNGGGGVGAITVNPPFRQSSSSMNINGQTKSRTEASFQVMGSTNEGVADLVAENGQIRSLKVSVGGRTIDLSSIGSGSPRSTRSTGSYGTSTIIDADVIDAEFVEKKKN